MDFTEAYSDTCTTVGLAARAGCLEKLRFLIEQGRCVSNADNRGWYPVHEAAVAGNVECLKLLLSQDDTEVDWQNFNGETALYLASTAGYFEAIEVLLSAGANPDLPNMEGATPLYQATHCNYQICCELLLEYKANVNTVYEFNGWTPLHAAAYTGNVRILKKLLIAGADISAVDDWDVQPIYIAAQYGNLMSLVILINAGCDVNAITNDGATPLFIAAQEGHTECIQCLLDEDADPDHLTDESSKPVHVAAEKNHTEVLKLLLPLTSLDHENNINFWSPLHSAIEHSNFESTKVILDFGVDVNSGFFASEDDSSGLEVDHSPLFLSYTAGEDLFDLLISRGATPLCDKYYDSCYILKTFDETNIPTTMIKKLFKIGLNPDCKCVKNFGYYINTFQHLEAYKCFLDCGLLPNVCSYLLHTDKDLSNMKIFQRALCLAICYEPPMSGLSPMCNLRTRLCSIKLPLDSEYRQQVEDIIESPSLQHLCRLKIREILKPKGLYNMQEFVSKMEITDIMKRYLLYEDKLTQMILKKE